MTKPTESQIQRIIISDMPPSANKMRKSFVKNGRVMSVKPDNYANWKSGAAKEISSQRPRRIDGPYALIVTVQRDWKAKRARDIDNMLKPVSDAIVASGLVQDDSLAERVTAQWGDDLGGSAVVIEICPFGEF